MSPSIELARDVRDGLAGSPGRFAIAVGAIAIGCLALALLVGVMSGFERRAADIVRSLGTGVFALAPPPVRSGGALTTRHASLLDRHLPDAQVAGARSYRVSTLGTSRSVTVVATDPTLAPIRQWRLVRGRFLDDGDLRARERVAVVGQGLANDWGWEVGAMAMLGNQTYRIIGVIDAGGGGMDSALAQSGLAFGDRAVFIPSTVQPKWERDPPPADRPLDAVFVGAKDFERYETVVAAAGRVLADPSLGAGKLQWITPATLVEGLRRLRNTVAAAVGGIAGLCLLLGATIMISVMVGSVNDRLVEIGLRRALGARRRDVAVLFLAEAFVLTCCAAVLGIGAAFLVAGLGGARIPVPIELGAAEAAATAIAVLAVGLVSAWIPARLAARTQPTEALKNP